mmetsp:Transcript_23980/g.26638  ORF Transcript_23980/g.26638 Transcript_23980/m.26638 type:complete len:474 (+) Transcript_23980:27-1448(+)|eukprot:CAMPEP_0205820236 /NCGR_PEP_ID=MMETSP0206-20130828/2850_1 /ASSEMBLY_ACC=CAM_ASM_000279 /TAXON_ID=36767 /ORGANISM="Euplotes focardii, Strain TN1" /LENGTH=473 /DNA_ID=CAMNT_0053114749 /DNA_START=24 /DNA_END=1445 /DNA_ORIENTATION=-
MKTTLAIGVLLCVYPLFVQGDEYYVNWMSMWSEENHGENTPANPHFSPPVYYLNTAADFAAGGTASPELEILAETGNPAPYIGATAGAGLLFPDMGGLDGYAMVAGMITAVPGDLLSALAMVAPSPDWFIGVRDIVLDAQQTYAPFSLYDAGTDSGSEFEAADEDTDPQGLIAPLLPEHGDQFTATYTKKSKKGQPKPLHPIGGITFTNSDGWTFLDDKRTESCGGSKKQSFEVTVDIFWAQDADAIAAGVHFSPGAWQMHEHAKDAFFLPGRVSSPEFKYLTEMGNAAHVVEATANTMLRPPVPTFGNVSDEVEVHAKRAFVTLAHMIAPSPDWFIGTAALDLCPGGEWINQTLTTVLMAMDGGTDVGATYTAKESGRWWESIKANPIGAVGTVSFTPIAKGKKKAGAKSAKSKQKTAKIAGGVVGGVLGLLGVGGGTFALIKRRTNKKNQEAASAPTPAVGASAELVSLEI